MSFYPLVSVILPVYNGGKYLRESIQSILFQTYNHFEFLIVNDGSTDNTHEIITSFDDNRIIYLQNSRNLGLIKSLNLALELCKGVFVARMDADDISFPSRLEEQVSYMKKNPDVVAVGTSIMIHGTSEVIQFRQEPEEIKSLLIFENPCAHPTLLIKRAPLKELGYNSSYPHAEDYKLIADLVSRGPVANLSQPLLLYRKHENQISSLFFQSQKNTHALISAEFIKTHFNLSLKTNVLKKFFAYESLNFFESFYLCVGFTLVFIKSLAEPSFHKGIIRVRVRSILLSLIKRSLRL